MTPADSYQLGQKFPYDDGDEGARPPQDWAHCAARGVLADLTDRRAIKNGFNRLERETRGEIVDTLAEIIRIALIEEIAKRKGNGS